MFGFFDNPNRQYNQGVSDFDANNSFMPKICEWAAGARNTLFGVHNPSRVSLYNRKPREKQEFFHGAYPLTCLTARDYGLAGYVVVKCNDFTLLRNCEGYIRALSLVALNLLVTKLDIDDEGTICGSGDLEGSTGARN